MRHIARSLLGLLLLVGVMTPLRAEESGVFEVQLAATGDTRTVAAVVTDDGTPLFPLLEIAALLEIPVERSDSAIVLHWPRGSRTEAAAILAAHPQESLMRDGEVFLSAPLLARIVGGDAKLLWSELQLVLTGTDYPIVTRKRNEERRAGLSITPRAAAEPPVPYPSRSGGATAEWRLFARGSGDSVDGGGRAAIATALLGGSLEAGTDASFGDVSRLTDPYLRYRRAIPNGHWVRQLELGDVRGGGVLSRAFRGVSVTNEPRYAPLSFGDALVRPVVPIGWEFEVYQGESLVGASQPGSAEPIATPLDYGVTPVRVRLIGPGGEERVEELSFLVPALQVPAGEWRYSAGAGECRNDDCKRLAFVDVRRGFSSRLTAGLGAENLARSDGDSTRLQGMLSFLVRPDMRAELRAREETLLQATIQQHARTGSWQLSGGWRQEERAARTVDVPRIWFADGYGAFRGSDVASVVINGYARRTSTEEPDQWRLAAATLFKQVQAGVAYESGVRRNDIISLTAGTWFTHGPFGRNTHWNVASRLDVSDDGFAGGALTANFVPQDRVNITAGLTWREHSATPALALGVLIRTRGAYVQSRTFIDRGQSEASISAAGGIAAAGHGVVVDPFDAIDRAGVRGVVFIDENADGTRNPGEPLISGVDLSIGADRATTGANGEFQLWGLDPYRLIEVAIDRVRLNRNDVVPDRQQRLIRLSPNIISEIDLPLLPAREVEGAVRWTDDRAARGGITIEAKNRADQNVVRSVTFSDGRYYFESLPAGEYTLTVSASSLDAMGAAIVEPIRFVVRNDDRESIEAPTLYLLQKH